MKLPEMDKLIIDAADGHPGAAGVAGLMLMADEGKTLEKAIEDNITGESLWIVYTEMAERDIHATNYLLKSGVALKRLRQIRGSNVYRNANDDS